MDVERNQLFGMCALAYGLLLVLDDHHCEGLSCKF